MKAKAENLYETHSEGGFLDEMSVCAGQPFWFQFYFP
jgi:hypothetical protein